MGLFRSWNKDTTPKAGEETVPINAPNPNAFLTSQAYLAQSQSQWGPAQNAMPTTAAIYTTGTGGSGPYFAGGSGLSTLGVPLGGYTNTVTTTTMPTRPGVAAPIGQSVRINFMDAGGHTIIVDVDIAHAGLLQQISNENQARLMALGRLVPSAPIMSEGDFSLDEMEKAEKLIEEMNGIS